MVVLDIGGYLGYFTAVLQSQFSRKQLEHGLAPLGLWIPLPSATASVRVASLNPPPFVMQGNVLTPGYTILG
jgi:hypothetical protein